MGQRILVADDEPSILLSLQVLLEKAGYDVHVARNGEEVLRLVDEAGPDLIILDAMMPARSGYDVCQELRQQDRWREVPIIMLTAKGREVDREKGLALGATDYVTKPFSTRELVETVRRRLGALTPAP
jgi:DNA-binding response OmpR family regulator